MFMLGGQTRRSTRNEGTRDLLAGQVVRGVKALESATSATTASKPLLWAADDRGTAMRWSPPSS